MFSQPASPDMLIVVIQLNWQGQTSPIECGGLGGCGVGGGVLVVGGGWLDSYQLIQTIMVDAIIFYLNDVFGSFLNLNTLQIRSFNSIC